MIEHLVTIEADRSVAEAAHLMWQRDVGSLLIPGNGGVSGIITDRDLIVQCYSRDHDPKECTVARHMTTSVITVPPEMDLLDALRILREEQILRLPVVSEGNLVGIVSAADLARALDEELHTLLLAVSMDRRA